MTDPLVAADDFAAADVPRGPHLPDAIVRIPLVVWPFVALAAWVAWIHWEQARTIASNGQGDAFLAIVGAIPPVFGPLVGAALFLRHRDASRTRPMLAFGVTLLAAHQVLQLAQPALAPLLERVAPGNQVDPPFVGPLVFGYEVVVGLVQAFAVVYVARGLASARRFVDGPRAGRIAVAAFLAALALPAVNAWTVIADAARFASQVPNVVASLAVGLVTMLAWAYLASTAVNGVRAGEEPRTGWLLAAVAASLFLAATAVIALVSGSVVALRTVEPGSPLFEAYLTVYRVFAVLTGAVWVLLAAAFATGMPAQDGPTDAGDVPDDDDAWDGETVHGDPVPAEA